MKYKSLILVSYKFQKTDVKMKEFSEYGTICYAISCDIICSSTYPFSHIFGQYLPPLLICCSTLQHLFHPAHSPVLYQISHSGSCKIMAGQKIFKKIYWSRNSERMTMKKPLLDTMCGLERKSRRLLTRETPELWKFCTTFCT